MTELRTVMLLESRIVMQSPSSEETRTPSITVPSSPSMMMGADDVRAGKAKAAV
jgi:hypothetical protein